MITSSCFEFLAKKHYWLLRIASWVLLVLILSKGTKNSYISRCCKGFGVSPWKGSSFCKSSNILLDQFMRIKVALRVSHALVFLVRSPCVINKQIVPTNCWKYSMEWIRNWLLMCLLEHDIVVVRILKFHIGNDKKIWVYMLMGCWALGMCGLSPLVQIILIFYYFIFWVNKSVYSSYFWNSVSV